jgi:hypothetical protein
MGDTTFDDITRPLLTTRPRREVLRRAFTSGVASLTAAGLGAMLVPEATAARKLCRKNGSRCKQKGKGCKARYCRPAAAGLRTPFTIEAHWGDANLDHDTNLFVPNAEGSTDPFPYVDLYCRPGESDCDTDVYPYVCVDDSFPTAEVATVRRLLPGVYQYWIEQRLWGSSDELRVLLRNADGRVLRSWENPPIPFASSEAAWHVCDIDGSTGHVTSVDQLVESSVPQIYADHTDVCPY